MDTLSRYKNPFVLAIVLMAQFVLLAVQVRRPFPAAAARVDQEGVRALRLGVTSVVIPPESVLHKSGMSVRDVWSSYLDLVGVRQQNAELKEEVDRLRLEQAALAEDARQGERLQDLLAFRQHYVNETVPAQVVGTSGTDRSHVLYLDKGSDDGIAADMPVITPDGIVGRVREVYPHTSQVLEISDPTSASGVLLEETRTRGILRGSPQGRPQIVNLMPDDRIKPGQVVLTSGGDQIFPRGLPVGVVDHIAPDLENEPMVNVVLKPAANLNRLEEVLIVTNTASAPTERARRDVFKSQLVAAGAKALKDASGAAGGEVQRASDVLAQRLPSRYDQADLYAPDATADSSPATSEAVAKPLHPPAALHADHYTPGDVPAAESLRPGQRLAPLVEGTASSDRRAPSGSAAGVNATDTAPVGNNPAFATASAAMAAERKAVADAKAAETARQYAAAHPGTLPAQPVADDLPASPPPAAVHYTERVNADGTITRVPVLAAKTPALYAKRVNADGTVAWVPASAGATQYVNRTSADGTVTHVAAPGPVPGVAPAVATATPGPLYIARVNADGSITHVPWTGASSPTPAVHYVNRTNTDGTVTRVVVPSTATPAVVYTTRTNADGTVSRVAVPASATPGSNGSAAAVRYTNRTNADGTVTRVPIPAIGASAAVAYTNRVNADGSVTRVPVPAIGASAAVTYTNRVNADGTLTRVPVTSLAGSASAVRYTNRTNADGTVTRVPTPAGAPAGASTTSPAARSTNRLNADGTVSRALLPAIGTANTPPVPRATAPVSPVTTRVIADGPLTPRARSAATTTRPLSPQANAPVGARSTQSSTGGANAPRPATTTRKTGPVLVPDDGSRPPAAPAPKPPVAQPQEHP